VSKDFDAHFARLVTQSLLRSADEEAERAKSYRIAPELRASFAARRSSDRRRVLRLLELDPSEVVGFLTTQSRARRSRHLLITLGCGALVAALSLLGAVVANGANGIWVAASDAVLVVTAIVACFVYVQLVSAETSTARRLRRFESTREFERRTGADRRSGGPGEPPGGVERRSGVDRRTIAARSWSDVT
jgi:hypothetical protein